MYPALNPMNVEIAVIPIADRKHQVPEDILAQCVGAERMLRREWQILQVGALYRRVDLGEQRQNETG
jgi:hypothetical protein